MGRRRRRRHSADFKAAVFRECLKPGVSIAAVTLAQEAAPVQAAVIQALGRDGEGMDSPLDLVELPEQFQRCAGDAALVGCVQFNELAPRMGHAANLGSGASQLATTNSPSSSRRSSASSALSGARHHVHLYLRGYEPSRLRGSPQDGFAGRLQRQRRALHSTEGEHRSLTCSGVRGPCPGRRPECWAQGVPPQRGPTCAVALPVIPPHLSAFFQRRKKSQ